MSAISFINKHEAQMEATVKDRKEWTETSKPVNDNEWADDGDYVELKTTRKRLRLARKNKLEKDREDLLSQSINLPGPHVKTSDELKQLAKQRMEKNAELMKQDGIAAARGIIMNQKSLARIYYNKRYLKKVKERNILVQKCAVEGLKIPEVVPPAKTTSVAESLKVKRIFKNRNMRLKAYTKHRRCKHGFKYNLISNPPVGGSTYMVSCNHGTSVKEEYNKRFLCQNCGNKGAFEYYSSCKCKYYVCIRCHMSNFLYKYRDAEFVQFYDQHGSDHLIHLTFEDEDEDGVDIHKEYQMQNRRFKSSRVSRENFRRELKGQKPVSFADLMKGKILAEDLKNIEEDISKVHITQAGDFPVLDIKLQGATVSTVASTVNASVTSFYGSVKKTLVDTKETFQRKYRDIKNVTSVSEAWRGFIGCISYFFERLVDYLVSDVGLAVFETLLTHFLSGSKLLTGISLYRVVTAVKTLEVQSAMAIISYLDGAELDDENVEVIKNDVKFGVLRKGLEVLENKYLSISKASFLLTENDIKPVADAGVHESSLVDLLYGFCSRIPACFGEGIHLFTKWAKEVLPAVSLINGVANISKALSAAVTKIWEWYTGNIKNTQDWIKAEVKNKESPVHIYSAEAAAYHCRSQLESVNAVELNKMRDKVVVAKAKCVEYLKSKDKLDSHSMRFMEDLDKITSTPPTTPKRDTEPFCILIKSKPGIRKSTYWPILLSQIYASMEEVLANTHTMSTSEYHTGMIGKKIILFDDFMQDTSTSREAMDFIRLKSIAVYSPNLANITGKEIKGMIAEPEFVVALSNVMGDPNVAGIADSEAIKRRFDIILKVDKVIEDGESLLYLESCPTSNDMVDYYYTLNSMATFVKYKYDMRQKQLKDLSVELKDVFAKAKKAREVDLIGGVFDSDKKSVWQNRSEGLIKFTEYVMKHNMSINKEAITTKPANVVELEKKVDEMLDKRYEDFIQNRKAFETVFHAANSLEIKKAKRLGELMDFWSMEEERRKISSKRETLEQKEKELVAQLNLNCDADTLYERARVAKELKAEREKEKSGKKDENDVKASTSKNADSAHLESYVSNKWYMAFSEAITATVSSGYTAWILGWMAASGVAAYRMFYNPGDATVYQWLKSVGMGIIVTAIGTFLAYKALGGSTQSGTTNTKKPMDRVVSAATNAVRLQADDSIIHIVKNATVSINVGGRMVNGIMIGGTQLLTVDHVFRDYNNESKYVSEGTMIAIATNKCNIVKKDVFNKKRLRHIDILMPGDKEVSSEMVVYELDKTIFNQAKNIVPHFWDGDYDPIGQGVFMLDYKNGAFTTNTGEITHTNRFMAPGGRDGDYIIQGGVASYLGRDGACGSSVLTSEQYPTKILGCHVGYNMVTNGSMFQYVTRQALEKVASSIDLDEAGILQCAPRKDFLVGHMEHVGEISHPIYQPTKTTLTQSLVYECAGPHTTEPSLLDYSDPRCTLSRDEFDKVMKEGYKLHCDLTTLDLLPAYVSMVEEHKSYERVQLRRILNPSEVLNGVPHVEGSTSVDLNTSPGYPYTQQGLKRKDLIIVGKDGLLEFSPRLKADYDDALKKIKSGIVPFLPFTITIKDERVKLSKIYENPKSRYFANASLIHLLIMRRYFMQYITKMYNNPVYSSDGLDRVSIQWHYVMERMVEVGINGFDGDYSNWDRSLNKAQIVLATKLALKAIKSTMSSLEYDTLIELISAPTYILGRTIFKIAGSMPSGSYLTFRLNCDINEMLHRTAYLKIMKERAPVFSTIKYYKEYTRGLRGGDDTIQIVSNRILDYFNGVTYANFVNSHGMKYTSPTKDSFIVPHKDFTQLSFLKNTTGYMDHYLVPLMEEKPMIEMCYWIRTTKGNNDKRKLTEDNCNCALRSAMFHGEEYFNSLRNKMLERCDKLQLLTYGELRNTFLIYGFYPGSHSDTTTDIDEMGIINAETIRKIPFPKASITTNMEFQSGKGMLSYDMITSKGEYKGRCADCDKDFNNRRKFVEHLFTHVQDVQAVSNRTKYDYSQFPEIEHLSTSDLKQLQMEVQSVLCELGGGAKYETTMPIMDEMKKKYDKVQLKMLATLLNRINADIKNNRTSMKLANLGSPDNGKFQAEKAPILDDKIEVDEQKAAVLETPTGEHKLGTSVISTQEAPKLTANFAGAKISYTNRIAVGANPDITWSLADLIERYTIIGTVTWDTTAAFGTRLVGYRIPQDFLVNDHVKEPFILMSLSRWSHINVKVVCQTSPNFSGRLLVGFTPPSVGNVVEVPQFISLGCKQIDASNNQPIDFQLPFVCADQYIDATKTVSDCGALVIQVLSPLRVGANEPDKTVRLMVYACFEGAEHKVPRNLQGQSALGVLKLDRGKLQSKFSSINDEIIPPKVLCPSKGLTNETCVEQFAEKCIPSIIEFYKRYKSLFTVVQATTYANEFHVKDIVNSAFPWLTMYNFNRITLRVKIIIDTFDRNTKVRGQVYQSNFNHGTYEFDSDGAQIPLPIQYFDEDHPAEFTTTFCNYQMVNISEPASDYGDESVIGFKLDVDGEKKYFLNFMVALEDSSSVGCFRGLPLINYRGGWDYWSPTNRDKGRLQSGIIEKVVGDLSDVIAKTIPEVVGTGITSLLMDRPSVTMEPELVKPRKVGYLNANIGPDYSERFTYDPSAIVHTVKEHYGSAEDQTQIYNIARMRSLFFIADWTTKDPGDTILWTMSVGPFANGPYPKGSTITGLDLASTFGAYWRGSIQYTVDIIASGTHSGTLVMTYHPNTRVAPATVQQSSSQYFMTMPIEQGHSCYSVLAPQLARNVYNKVWNGEKITDDNFESYFNGTIALRVMAPLRTPSTGSPSIQVIVYVNAGPDYNLRKSDTLVNKTIVPQEWKPFSRSNPDSFVKVKK